MDFPVWVRVSTAGPGGGFDIQAWCVRIKGLRTQREQETPRDSLKKFGLLWQLEILSVEQTYGRANCLSPSLHLFQYESRDY